MGMARTFFYRKKPVPDREAVRRIVVFHFGGVGDMILTTPALRSLAEHYPNAKISFVGSHINHFRFLARYPFVKDLKEFNVYPLDSRGVFRTRLWNDIAGIAHYLRKEPIDILINLHNPFLIDWWFIEFLVIVLVKPLFSVGVNPCYLRQSIYDLWISELELQGKHYKDFFLEVVGLLGVPTEHKDTEFPVMESDHVSAGEIIKNQGFALENLICLHPSGQESRRWPAEKFKELSLKLGCEDRKILVLGTAADTDLSRIICHDNPYAKSLAGQTTLAQTAAIMKRCRLFVGNDSGPFHLAVAVGTPAVALIGGGPLSFHLYSGKDVKIIKKSVPCAPCDVRVCPNMHCMNDISVEEVETACREMLEKSSRQGKPPINHASASSHR